MSLHRATRDLSAPAPLADTTARQPVGPAVLFIAAVLIAGLTCILYLWQQSQIVAGRQDLQQINSNLTLLTQQRNDLLAQEQKLTAVTHVVAEALKYGMVQGDPRTTVKLSVQTVTHSGNYAQVTPNQRRNIVLPATNAAITFWWQNAWDGLYNLLQ